MIKKAKPYWAAFNASSYIKELTVGNIWLVHGYSNDIFQADLDAQAARRTFTILQGDAEGRRGARRRQHGDPQGAPRPDLAYQFINFMLEGKNSAELTNLIGSGNPNAAAMKYINPTRQGQPGDLPRPRQWRRSWSSCRTCTRRDRRLRNRLWTEIKVR